MQLSQATRLDIKPCDTKGQRITHFIKEFVELHPEFILWAGSYHCYEKTEDEDASVLLPGQWKETYREWKQKIKKTHIASIKKEFENDDETWDVVITFHVYDLAVISVATEAEANALFDAIDTWLFT